MMLNSLMQKLADLVEIAGASFRHGQNMRHLRFFVTRVERLPNGWEIETFVEEDMCRALSSLPGRYPLCLITKKKGEKSLQCVVNEAFRALSDTQQRAVFLHESGHVAAGHTDLLLSSVATQIRYRLDWRWRLGLEVQADCMAAQYGHGGVLREALSQFVGIDKTVTKRIELLK